MIDSVKICAFAIICAVICVFIKNYRGEFLIPTRMISIIVILGFAIVIFSPISEFLKNIVGQTISLEYSNILIKAICLAYLSQISSEICRDCGENNIASGIETIMKIEMLILSIPLINDILEMSRELILW